MTTASTPAFVTDPARTVPVADDTDVLVCGGGPAGVAAAVSAARDGASVRLLEAHGCLGGVWTAGLLSAVIDADKPGFMAELVGLLDEREAYRPRTRSNFLYDPEQMKLVLEQLCVDAGVRIQLHTRICSAQVDQHGAVHVALSESKSSRQAWRARIFIDCTGDGDLAAQAGCRFEFGEDNTGRAQPLSLLAIVAGVDAAAAAPYYDHRNPQRKTLLLEQMGAAGHRPSYAEPTLFHIRDSLFALMANHEYGIRPDDAQAISDATIRARSEVDQAVRALRSLGGPWTTLELVATAAQLGVREGRRIVGRDTVRVDDLVRGRRRADAVCRSTFAMDVHALSPDFDLAGFYRTRPKVRPYDIPYGALVPADVDGLLTAGRCISGDFLSHSSYRVTGNAVAMGEAAGRAAAACARLHLLPHQLAYPHDLRPSN